MKLSFNQVEYKLSHWKVERRHIFYRELYSSSLADKTAVVYKFRSIGATGMYGSMFRNDNIYISRISKLGDPLKYAVYGEGLLSDAGLLFNKIYQHPIYNEIEIEIAKMNVTNFLIKYKKNYLYL